jgi:hypothetical protein
MDGKFLPELDTEAIRAKPEVHMNTTYHDDTKEGWIRGALR